MARALTEQTVEIDRAMQRAGRWLALRPRTQRELSDRLLEGGFDADVVDATIARLIELDLIDDLAFARQWIGERGARKGLAASALVAELLEKGVEREIAEQALDDEGLDEESNARKVAAAHLRKVTGLPLPQQAARIQGALIRRGFSTEVARAAARAVLPPEGWD